ncbi:hypothetical protein [Capillimicrobium parvum]|uniref:Uncharacterized protein n=1 Tax=Capillimicrobium parvum TaxID=2884022 RepID=A0A9E6XYL5_9ACTN|nr:hypothetical protein [Capillimicrobium parvum]UGS36353.1 hypothetical protein DSM104329_02757 [Capillimicrobium parvum]
MKPVYLVRWGLPLALVAAGVIVLVETDIEGVGEALIAAAICTVIANLIFRLGFGDQHDRDREEAAREFFDAHGHWPDETPRG